MKFFCVSGYHNVGKTTFILKFLDYLKSQNQSFAVIKSTHHKDIVNKDTTKDTTKFLNSGADIALVSPDEILIEKKKKIIKHFNQTESLNYIIFKYFFSYDWVILEGFKYLDFPKIEIVKELSDINFEIKNRLCFVINENLLNENAKQELLEKLKDYFPKTPIFFFKDISLIYKFLNKKLKNYKIKVFVDLKEVNLKPFVENLFYNLLISFLDSLKDTQGKSIEIFFERKK